MATLIPRAPLPQDNVAPVPVREQTTRLDTRHIQQGVQRLGAMAQGFIQVKQQEADLARLSEARADLAAFGNALNDPENPDGLMSYRGEAALTANERLLPKADQRIAEMRKRLPRRLQGQFAEIAAGWRETLADGLNRHMATESQRFMADKARAVNDTMASEAVLHGLNGAPDLQQASVAELQAVNARRLTLEGAPPEVIAAASAVTASGVYRATALGLSNRSLPEAVAYYNRTAEQLTAEDRIAVEATIFPAIRADAGTAAAMAAINGGEIAGVPTMRTGESLASDAADVQRQYAALGDRHGFVTTSTTRSPQENERVGGVANSQHLDHRGTARDWSVKGKTPAQIQAFVSDLRAAGFEVITQTHGTGPHIHAELPPVTRSRERTAYAGPARTELEALQRVRESAIGSDPVALRNAEQTIAQEFAYRKAAEAEQERSIGLAILDKVAGAAPNAALGSVLTPAEVAFLASHESVNAAVNRYRTIMAGAGVIQDDPLVVDSLQRLQANDPAGFAQLPLAEYGDKLSGATFKAFVEDQAKARQPGKAAQWATEGELLTLAIADLGLAGDTKAQGEFKLAYFREKRAFVAEHKHEPNADEAQVIVNRLKQPMARRTWWGAQRTRRAYQGAAEGFTVPAAARAQVIQALQAAGVSAPSEEQIIAAYLSVEDPRL